MQFYGIGRTLYIDLCLSTLVRPFSIFHNGICVSEPRFIWSYKNKCIIFTILYSSVQGRSVPIAKFPLD